MKQLWSKEWFERVSPLFVAVFIVNALAVFKQYWWPQTFSLVYWSIAVAAVSRCLLPNSLKWKRYVLELILIVLLSIYYADIVWNGIKLGEAESKLAWIYQHALQLHPFIGIAIVVYCIQSIYSSWITKRTRMYIFAGLALLLISIKDSFSPLILWPNIAMIVFAFLIWHALFHLSTLQRKHQQSFNELWEYPSGIIAPFIIIFTLLVIVGTLVPSRPPILEDPYTLWKQSKGESVPAFLGEKGFSSPLQLKRETVTSSGYSRDDGQLGGSFNFNYEPVMEVYTTHKSYWRGESRWFYSGKGWEEKPQLHNDSQPLPVLLGMDFSMNAYPLASTLEVEQVVTFREPSSFPVLFAAAKPFQIDHINEAIELDEGEANPQSVQSNRPLSYIRWVGEDSKLIYLAELAEEPVTSYSIKSNILLLDKEGLQQSESKLSDEVEQEAYTSLPDALPERIFELAEEVTAEASNDYERAVLLEQHLKLHYSYTNSPDASKLTGQSEDFVDQFLFELMEGYCDYFSTAMVVMARTLDMPARWVKGFAPGVSEQERFMQQSPFEEQYVSSPHSTDTYTVRNADAHSWVEIYFADYGWVSFEPTPGFQFPYSVVETASNEELVVLPDLFDEQTPKLNKPRGLSSRFIWSLLASILTIIVVISIVYYIFLLVKRRTARMTVNERIIQEVHQFLIYCKWRGLKRKSQHTLRETFESWDQGSPDWQRELRTLLTYYELASYSREQLTVQELDQLRAIKKYLKKNWKR